MRFLEQLTAFVTSCHINSYLGRYSLCNHDILLKSKKEESQTALGSDLSLSDII